MPIGTVKWYSAEKGYGFIVPDIAGQDIFVHRSAISNFSLEEGDRVCYDIGNNKGKSCAVNVSPMD